MLLVDGPSDVLTKASKRGSSPFLEETSGFEVQLSSGFDGCFVQFAGALNTQARMILWELGAFLAHEVRVEFDFSGVASFDGPGLEAGLGLMDTVRSFGGRTTIGSDM